MSKIFWSGQICSGFRRITDLIELWEAIVEDDWMKTDFTIGKAQELLQFARRVGKLGINGFLEQYAQCADLNPSLPKERTLRVSANDSLNAQDPASPGTCAEADRNIQYTVRVCYSTPNIYFSTPSRTSYIPDLGVEDDSEPYGLVELGFEAGRYTADHHHPALREWAVYLKYI
ncbi:hypothetical protein HOY80DRAFT_1004311 [Tuber brumale]|nr:hypothetical protein HOY80DRAFT_1004311 [Tuber brumale]